MTVPTALIIDDGTDPALIIDDGTDPALIIDDGTDPAPIINSGTGAGDGSPHVSRLRPWLCNAARVTLRRGEIR